MLLFDTEVFALTGNPKTEQVAIKGQALVGVRNNDGRMVNPEKQWAAGLRLRASLLPLRIALSRREENNFEYMVFRVAKVKCLDACRAFIPHGERLRRSRYMLHFVLAQLLIRSVHVAHDDGDMLKPMVVTL